MRAGCYFTLLFALAGTPVLAETTRSESPPEYAAEDARPGPENTAVAAEEATPGPSTADPDQQDVGGSPPTAERQPTPNAEPAGTAGKPANAPRVAPNLDLKEIAPVPLPVEAPPSAPVETPSVSDSGNAGESVPEEEAAVAEVPNGLTPAPVAEATPGATPAPATVKAESLVLLGAEVKPGTATRLGWSPDTTGTGLSLPTPVLIINGENAGPTLCLTAAVHGDELNGIEIVRRIMYDTDPSALSGRLIGVPIVNVPGFQQGSRYMPDRRDLNRNFPGDPKGSLAARVAHSFFNEVIRHCDMLVDIHTGSLKRTNLPQLRADMNNTEIAEFTRGFDGMAVVHGAGGEGMLRTAAIAAGIVAVTLEAGESHRVQEEQIKAGVNSISSLLERQKMISRLFVWGDPEPVYYESDWIRTNEGGILSSDVELGDDVVAGQVLGVVTDPITNEHFKIVAKEDGRVIGMAVDQVVMAGFATYHIGTEARGPSEE